MRTSLCLLIIAACVFADRKEERKTKIPYIADAVGNKLPPPPNGPATVGSPVNLLTPDRYEFYTFDESGELVKRLMTLEEIQAIVAAGEESDGLVTFANENQPTITFNFSQPPYNKVHSVVTNVQNVLKAQMEAHKDKPIVQPTLDTPDVSNSWSLILPTIFGNTGGVDFVPDKVINSFTTPDTETIDEDIPVNTNSLSKEGNNQLPSKTTTIEAEDLKEKPITEKILSTEASTTTTSTTSKPTTTSTTSTTSTTLSTTTSITSTTSSTTTKPQTTPSSTATKAITTTTNEPRTKSPTTTTYQPTIFSSTQKYISSTPTTAKSPETTTKPKTTSSTTVKPKPSSTTTVKPRTSTASTSRQTTTTKPKTSTAASSIKQTFKTTLKATTVKATTYKPTQTTTVAVNKESSLQTTINDIQTSEKNTVNKDKPINYLPVSTVSYTTQKQTEKTTNKQSLVTKSSESTLSTKSLSPTTTVRPKITTYKPPLSSSTNIYTSTVKDEDEDKTNITTITTQSISPSTTVSTTPNSFDDSYIDEKVDSMVPLFDVAQSISQIASDLGNNYQSMPTTSDLLETTKVNLDVESKENFEIDIPTDNAKINSNKTAVTDKTEDNFVKISTIDPHPQETKEILVPTTSDNKTTTTVHLSAPGTTTIDPILSESMDDLLSQIVNENPLSMVTESNNTAFLNNSIENQYNNSISNNTASLNINNVNKTKENNQDQSLKNQINSNENIVSTTQATTTTLLTSTISEVQTSSTPSTIFTTTVTESNDIPQYKNNTENQINEQKKESQDFIKISESYKENNGLNDTLIISTTAKIEISNKNSQISSTESAIVENNVKVEKVTPTKNTFKPFSKVEFIPKPSLTANVSSNNVTDLKNVTKENKLNDKIKEQQETIPKDEFKKKFQKVNIDDKELSGERNNSWKLISTVTPPKSNEISKDKVKTDTKTTEDKTIVLDYSQENQGLEVTTKDLGDDIAQFTLLCNELAFRYWNALIDNIDKKRSFVLSPFSITSMLAMMFMGARGSTSGEMNEILKLDDMVTFNPHFTLKNISDSIETSSESGVAVSAFVRELYSDKNKGRVLTFYKERAQHFYSGHVEEVNFNLISDIIRRRTNLLVKRLTWGRITEFMKTNNVVMQPPLAAFSANIFYTDCSKSSVDGRDGEMYFVVSPNVRQRRLVPVPAVVYRDAFLAGYDPVLDATAAALGSTKDTISTLFLMPGQQGNVVHAEDLETLEKRLLDSNPTTLTLNRILRTLLPRIGLELQIPRFSHKSVFNVSSTLKRMGLKDLFDADHADLGGLTGPSKDLFLSDMVQQTTFVTCGEGAIGEQHHIEEYPESLEPGKRKRQSRWTIDWDEPRDYQRAFHDPHDLGEAMNLPLHLRPRQARLPARNAQPARLKFDRPFLYFVRHNPSGMILYVGRYNPRLMP